LPAAFASRLAELSVHGEEPARARAGVEVVDVLGNEQELARPFLLEARERFVGGVRLYLAELAPAQVVELVHERGVTREALGRGHVFHAVAFPKPVRIAERRDAAFRGDAGTGEHYDHERDSTTKAGEVPYTCLALRQRA